MAAAATLGVLIGSGHVRGAPLQPVNAIAHMLFGTRAFLMEGFDWAITPTALALHLGALIVWGVLFALLAGRLRGGRLVGAALVYAGGVFLVDRFVIPEGLAPGFEQALAVPELAAVYLVLAFALALGVRVSGPAAA